MNEDDVFPIENGGGSNNVMLVFRGIHSRKLTSPLKKWWGEGTRSGFLLGQIGRPIFRGGTVRFMEGTSS